jgi:hypothetical protein
LVRRPYGLHAIPAIIQTHASHKARGPIAKTTSSSILLRQPHPDRLASFGTRALGEVRARLAIPET